MTPKKKEKTMKKWLVDRGTDIEREKKMFRNAKS